MSEERAPRDETWKPLPREVLDSPEMQARIEQARRRIATGQVTPGHDAEQLRKLAEERRASVDP